MAAEIEIKQALDLLTVTRRSQIESLGAKEKGHVESLRSTTNSDNIVALGISEKVSDKAATGELALTFYVEKKLPLAELDETMRVPSYLPEGVYSANPIITDVVEIGKIQLETAAATTPPNITRKVIQPGYSIGHFNISAGTLGALVKKGKSKYFLSNSHVFANSGLGKKGDAILYPGAFDGGVNPVDVIGSLYDFQPFNTGGAYTNYADCALAKPSSKHLKNAVAAIKDLGMPTGISTAKRGMKVVKVGRTTDKTIGEVKDVHFRTIINYPGVGDVGFMDQVFCTRYTEPGDSGSLVLNSDNAHAVGLHFAGADGGSIFNPINKVLESLGVHLMIQ